MATTIMISTSVKPICGMCYFSYLLFVFLFLRRELPKAVIMMTVQFTYCLLQRKSDRASEVQSHIPDR